MSSTPFVNPDQIAPLYAAPARLAQRTGSLHAAKISGDDATATIARIASRLAPTRPTVCDIGCGRGTTTLALAAALTPRRLIALDRSAALLRTVRDRAAPAGHTVDTTCADFHHLPLAASSIDIAVAAFCLYHSPHPDHVIAEITRCLTPNGHAVLITKSADSYREIDHLMQTTGLDPDATARPSLYTSFHSDNASDITATASCLVEVTHHRHVFRFSGLEHLATYVATSPKYELPDRFTDAAALAAELRRRIPNRPLTATSTVTYITAAP